MQTEACRPVQSPGLASPPRKPTPNPQARSSATFFGRRLDLGIVKSASQRRGARSRSSALPPFFTRWPHQRAAPWRRGHQRGDSGAQAAAVRAALPLSQPPGFQQRRWEPCRGAHGAGAPGAAHREGAGVWGSGRKPVCASPGAGCEPQSLWGSFYNIWVQPGRAVQLVQCGESRRRLQSTFPSALSFPPSLFSSRPDPVPATESPAGSYRPLSQLSSPCPFSRP